MSDFNITLFEACEILNKSKKTISRYIRQGKLHPQEVKSQCGTLEYRFTRLDLEAFRQDGTRQDRQDRTGQTGQNDDIKENGITNINLEETGRDTEDRTRKTGQKKEIAKITENQEETGRDRTGHGRQDGTRQDRQDNEIITLLKETTGVLKDQLTIKDKQIESLSGKIDQLIERSRETNILIKGLQDKILLLGTPKEPASEPVKTGKSRTTIKQEPDLINNDNKILAEIEENKDNNKRNAVKQGKQEKRGFFKKLFG